MDLTSSSTGRETISHCIEDTAQRCSKPKVHFLWFMYVFHTVNFVQGKSTEMKKTRDIASLTWASLSCQTLHPSNSTEMTKIKEFAYMTCVSTSYRTPLSPESTEMRKVNDLNFLTSHAFFVYFPLLYQNKHCASNALRVRDEVRQTRRVDSYYQEWIACVTKMTLRQTQQHSLHHPGTHHFQLTWQQWVCFPCCHERIMTCVVRWRLEIFNETLRFVQKHTTTRFLFNIDQCISGPHQTKDHRVHTFVEFLKYSTAFFTSSRDKTPSEFLSIFANICFACSRENLRPKDCSHSMHQMMGQERSQDRHKQMAGKSWQRELLCHEKNRW